MSFASPPAKDSIDISGLVPTFHLHQGILAVSRLA